MGDSNETFTLRCAFCGHINEYSEEDLYEDSANGKRVYRDKFCGKCGESITFICPMCQKTFPMEEGLLKSNPFKVLPSYNDPIHSELDDYIPLLETDLENYKDISEKLDANFMHSHLADFCRAIPDLQIKLNALDARLNTSIDPATEKIFDKDLKENRKNVKKLIEDTKDIFANIDRKTCTINEKKEKELRKHIPFPDINANIQAFIKKLQTFRTEQNRKEIEALKPGFEKIKDHLQFDPNFFRLICPICSAQVYGFNHQIYIFDKETNQLQFNKALVGFASESAPQQSLSLRVIVGITIYLTKESHQQFHGQLILNISEGNPESLGRNVIREAEYQEPEAFSVLTAEDDPLKYISNTQLSLEKHGSDLFIKGKEYDADRPGIYLNSLEDDIRTSYTSGVAVRSTDKILIPLTIEIDNINVIELQFQY